MSLCPETELLQGEDEFEDIDWDDTQVEEATGNFSLSLSLSCNAHLPPHPLLSTLVFYLLIYFYLFT
jgi:hypothetical protein